MARQKLLTPLLGRNWRSIASAIFGHMLYATIPMQTPIAVGMIVAALSGESAKFYGLDPISRFGVSPTVFAVSLLAVLACLTSLAAYYRSIATGGLSRRIVADLRVGAIDAVFQMDDSTYGRLGPVELQDRIVNECAQVRRYIERVFVHAVVNVVRIAYPLIMLFAMDTQLAVAAVAVLTPQTLVSFWVMRWLHDATRTARERRASLNRQVAKLVMQRDDTMREKACELVSCLENEEMAAKRFSALNMSNVWLFTSAGIALIWWLGSRSVSEGNLGLGELVAFVGMLTFVYQPMRQFTQIANTSRRGMVALERLREIHFPPIEDGDIRVVTVANLSADKREAV